MKQNAEDGGNRRYIMVQLPESIDEPKTLDDGTTLRTIADITRERIRRAGSKIATERVSTASNSDGQAQLDIGFRSYRLDTSNFRPWDGSLSGPASQTAMGFVEDPARQIALRLKEATDNIVDGRSSEDILVEIILKLGYELTVPVARLTLAGKEVFSVDGGAVLVCLNSSLTLDVIEAMADRNPGQIVCLDSGFNDNDELKVNASQIIRSKARSEDSSIVFKVV
jgi:adenine-specific DNA-methyltransferase